MSQEDLAKAAGISQATVSRLEKGEQTASVKTLAKLARALGITLTELAPPSTLPPQETPSDTFWGFCDNPFCQRNKFKLDEKKVSTVYWESWQQYSCESWADTNFCKSCGNDLVKECANCEKVLDERNLRFCIRCGKRITSRPTKDEWKTIEAQLKPTPPVEAEEEADDGIPF